MTKLSRILIAVAALALIVTNFVPLWTIELSAPQYPEGLMMEIWTFKLGGDVDVVNGLNHYIGMKTMHTEDFIEFTILPYLIWFTILFGLTTAALSKRKLLYVYACWVVVFGVVAMADFYKWEYDYGHHLNPNAPIQVPGMTYQPPFIGFKQLLNFGAYSIPALGGFLFIFNALAVLGVTFFAWKKSKYSIKLTTPVIASAIILLFTLQGCSRSQQPINYGKDACDFCRMTIIENKFGGEIISNTGKAFKFDDLKCMQAFIDNNYLEKSKINTIFIVDYNSGALIEANYNTPLLKSAAFKSPMAGNIAAFTSSDALKTIQKELGGDALQCGSLFNVLKPEPDRSEL